MSSCCLNTVDTLAGFASIHHDFALEFSHVASDRKKKKVLNDFVCLIRKFIFNE